MITILHVLTTIFVVTVQALDIRKTTDTEILGDLTIHCGDGIHDMVNITYFGDISGMYPVDKNFECSSQEITPIHHVIYNVNGRDCGFKEINSTRVWSVTVRLQKGFLVTVDDKVVNLACAYEHINSAVYNMSFQQDTAGIYVPSNKVNTENLLLQPYHLKDAVFDILSNILHPSPNISIDVFDDKENLITTLYSKSSVYLRFSFRSLIASAYKPPIIYSCNVTDDERKPRINRQIIKSGCNDKYVLSANNARTPKNVEDIMIISSESELISIPLSWTDTVDNLYFICEVMVCEKQLPCKQICPVDTSFLKTDSEKVYKIKAKSRLLNVSQDSAPKPPDNPESSKRESNGGSSATYLPYLIITCALIVLLIIFGVVLVCVIREQMLSNRMKDLDIINRITDMRRPQSLISDLEKSFGKGDSGMASSRSSSRPTSTEPPPPIVALRPHDAPLSPTHSTPRRVSFTTRTQPERSGEFFLQPTSNPAQNPAPYPESYPESYPVPGPISDPAPDPFAIPYNRRHVKNYVPPAPPPPQIRSSSPFPAGPPSRMEVSNLSDTMTTGPSSRERHNQSLVTGHPVLNVSRSRPVTATRL